MGATNLWVKKTRRKGVGRLKIATYNFKTLLRDEHVQELVGMGCNRDRRNEKTGGMFHYLVERRTSDSRLREPGFVSCDAVLKPWASFFHSTLHQCSQLYK